MSTFADSNADAIRAEVAAETASNVATPGEGSVASTSGGISVNDGGKTSHSEMEKARLDLLLKNRPDAKELQDKNILRDSNVAPALQAKQEELRKRQLEDRLGKELEHRPERDELEAKGILKGGNVAPALQAKQEELRKAQLEDTLEKGLEKRPTKEELEAQGILQPGE